MRRTLVALPLLALAAGCGGGEEADAPDPGADVFARSGCGGCHTFAAAGSQGSVGPNLDEALVGQDAASVRAFIVDPPRDGLMPEDFGERLTDEELDDLAAFLVERRED